MNGYTSSFTIRQFSLCKVVLCKSKSTWDTTLVALVPNDFVTNIVIGCNVPNGPLVDTLVEVYDAN